VLAARVWPGGGGALPDRAPQARGLGSVPGRVLRQLVRARPGVIPFPLPDGSVRFVPVLGEARQPLQRELGDVGRLAPAVTGVGVLVPFRLRARVLPRTPLRTVGACRKSAAEPK